MTTEIFSAEQFEAALPKHRKTNEILWRSLGFKNGEMAYLVTIPGFHANIEIRSSIGTMGYARAAGEDSIRAWLVDSMGNSLGSKTQKYVTRVAGWDRRMLVMLRALAHVGRHVKPCPVCSDLTKVFKVKKEGPNKGRYFVACKDACKQFSWIQPGKGN